MSVFASETSVSAGKLLVHEGDYSYDLIVIETGTADVIKAGEVIASLGPGDVLGEMGMLSGGRRTADVIATSPMHLITLSKWDFKRISDGDQRPAAGTRRAATGSSTRRTLSPSSGRRALALARPVVIAAGAARRRPRLGGAYASPTSSCQPDGA